MRTPEPESIYIVDDDPTALALYEITLQDAGYGSIISSKDSREVLNRLCDNKVSLILLDINMAFKSGIEVLKEIVEVYPDLPVIMITGDEDLTTAVKCVKIGAYDYLVKPPEKTRLVTAVAHALEWRELHSQLSAMGHRVLHRDSLEFPQAFEKIITASDAMISIFQYVEAVAPTKRPILITGESGTGKELLAQAIHQVSGRKGSLVTVNVAGLDDALFSDTLFGHVKGAFTDAATDRPGLVEKSAGGTLFLDEIGDLAPASQVKLLRLLQEKEYYPLGSDEARSTDARIIAATCTDLPSLISEGLFRKDLYFRLMAHHVSLPPLRDRQEDLMPLVKAFLVEAADELGRSIPGISPELKSMLQLYRFPGNVRELHSLVFDALSRSSGGVLNLSPFRGLMGDGYLSHIGEFYGGSVSMDYNGLVSLFGNFPTVKEVTDILYKAAMEKAEGNQSLASRLLGVHPSTLYRRLTREN